jgi:hypothetical protein
LISAAFQRAAGVIRRPRATLAAVTVNPRWVALLAAATLAAAAANAAVLSTEVGRQALVDQWERTALAFGQEVDDARYAEFQQWSTRGAFYGVAAALVNVPVAALAAAAAVYGVFGRRDRSVRFGIVVAVTAHTGVILALRLIAGAAATYVRETTASATSLGIWFPALDESSPVARLLGLIDLFAIWWVVVLAIGVSVLYGRRTAPVAAGLTGVYVGVAAALALIMAAMGGAA